MQACRSVLGARFATRMCQPLCSGVFNGWAFLERGLERVQALPGDSRCDCCTDSKCSIGSVIKWSLLREEPALAQPTLCFTWKTGSSASSALQNIVSLASNNHVLPSLRAKLDISHPGLVSLENHQRPAKKTKLQHICGTLQWDFATAWAELLTPVPARTPTAARTDPAGGGSVRGPKPQDQLVQPQSWTRRGQGQGARWTEWFRENSSAF